MFAVQNLFRDGHGNRSKAKDNSRDAPIHAAIVIGPAAIRCCKVRVEMKHKPNICSVEVQKRESLELSWKTVDDKAILIDKSMYDILHILNI